MNTPKRCFHCGNEMPVAQYSGQTNDESPEAAMLRDDEPGYEDGPWVEGWLQRSGTSK